MSKIMVAYFSASGVTARAAKEIAEAVGGDVFEIAPEEAYTRADIDWTDASSRSSREMADDGCRPRMSHPAPDMRGYDTVFLGFPVWWYVEPRIVDSFLAEAELAGKHIIPFCTSGSSGITGAERRMKELRPDAKWAHGRRLSGDAAAWAKSVLRD